MITDALLRVSTDQTLKLNATSAVSSYSIDVDALVPPLSAGGLQARDMGEGKQIFFNFAITEAVASAATTVTFEVIGATTADLGTGVISLGTSGAVAYGSLTLGSNVAVSVSPLIGSKGVRYIGTRYTVAGDNSGGTGKVTADVVETIQDGKKFYANGFTIA